MLNKNQFFFPYINLKFRGDEFVIDDISLQLHQDALPLPAAEVIVQCLLIMVYKLSSASNCPGHFLGHVREEDKETCLA